jgi:uncharacterized membrane protein YeiH
MIITLVGFWAIIIVLVITSVLVKRIRRSIVKRRVPYELSLLEDAIVLSLFSGILYISTIDMVKNWAVAIFILSLLKMAFIPILMVIHKVNRRAYVGIKRCIRKFM